jgi:hypothetical protein
VTRQNGSLSSQDNGAQSLPGTYTTRPAPGNINKTNSYVSSPDLGTRKGADKLGKAVGRK